ncbi:MAG: hypothetical protein DDT40_01589 [candidate division WS2 bacterium]|nr:hypothetical protein [Candidatus Psychracetigena formicireducens]
MVTDRKIGYINKEIPEFEVPEYKGQRYDATVPDTLDIQERAMLAVNGLTGPTDPDADCEIYWWVEFAHNPPMMLHDFCDHVQVTFFEALLLMRIISGSKLNLHIEKKWMEVELSMLGPDGLAHTPKKGRPWHSVNLWTGEGFLRPELKMVDQAVNPSCFNGRDLSAMSLWYLRDKSPIWKNAVKKMVIGLKEMAIDKGDYAYFDIPGLYIYKERRKDAPAPRGETGCTSAWVAFGLVHAYRVFGYEPALELAGKLLHCLRYEYPQFGANGTFLGGGGASDPYRVHFHAHTYVLLAMLEYAITIGDKELMEFVRNGYEYAKYMGCPLIGFFPEHITTMNIQTAETCEIADMIALGLKLTDAGVGDYFDDVDRWVRNQFAENQLTHVEWVEALAEKFPYENKQKDPAVSHDKVAERNLGAFASWPSPNDWQRSIMHCCTGEGARVLYHIWENILHYNNGKLRINLLLNRASKWADIDSHIPYTGQVDVKIKQELDLLIRIPEWVKPEEVKVSINGTIRKLTFSGRYAEIGKVKPKTVTITFPIFERTDIIFVEKQKYTIVRKGNDVVSIDPPGRYCPLYQRTHYRKNQTRWKKIERFVSDKLINW